MPGKYATPKEITAAAARKWSELLHCLITGQDVEFPLNLRLPIGHSLLKDLPYEQARQLVEDIRLASIEHKGVGYSVTYHSKTLSHSGREKIPKKIFLQNLDDYLDLTGRRDELKAIMFVCVQVRTAFEDKLDFWLEKRRIDLSAYTDIIDQLIQVTQAMINLPQSECYIRELDVPADTKFVQKHEGILRDWWNKLLPAHRIDAGESSFALRFGLLDSIPHYLFRILDEDLQNELQLPMDVFSAPIDQLNKLAVRDCNIIVVENKTNLMTLPNIKRGLALGGVGNAVTRLAHLAWLKHNRLYYWGDVDSDGFEMLSRFRAACEDLHVTSLMMDTRCVAAFPHHWQKMARQAELPSRLETHEAEVFNNFVKSGNRLEQEHVSRAYVSEVLSSLNLL